MCVHICTCFCASPSPSLPLFPPRWCLLQHCFKIFFHKANLYFSKIFNRRPIAANDAFRFPSRLPLPPIIDTFTFSFFCEKKSQIFVCLLLLFVVVASMCRFRACCCAETNCRAAAAVNSPHVGQLIPLLPPPNCFSHHVFSRNTQTPPACSVRVSVFEFCGF